MATKYEMSKTYQYRKVMKPLLERKRRARINKCLDELKDLMATCLEQVGGETKFEKADILEVTVQHLRKLKAAKMCNQQQQQQQQASLNPEQSFRAGYIRAANEVSRCLASLPKVDVAFGTSLMTHLGMRLNQLESVDEERNIRPAVNAPLSISCGSGPSVYTAANTSTTSSRSSNYSAAAYSPVSSGYASDSDCTSMRSSPGFNKQSLLQVSNAGANVWRPW